MKFFSVLFLIAVAFAIAEARAPCGADKGPDGPPQDGPGGPGGPGGPPQGGPGGLPPPVNATSVAPPSSNTTVAV